MTNKRTRGGSRKEPPTAQRKRAREATLFEHVVGALLYLWGSNAFGQLGFGETIMERVRPALSTFEKKAVDVAPGGMHTVVLLEDGTLWSAGVNDDGALGRETAVDDDGEPVPGKDATHFGQVDLPTGAAPVVQLACSDSASFALTLDGSVYGWGTFRNEHGVFGFSERVKRQETPARVYVPGGRKAPVTKIAAGANHVVGILEDGGAISWGDGDQGQLGRVSLRHSRRPNVIRRTMLTPTKIAGCRSMQFSDVFCGEYSTFLRAANGHFFAFGLNNCCQLAIPHLRPLSNEDTQTPESRASNLVTLLKPTWVEAFQTLNIIKVAPGKDHGIGVNDAGCVYSWGVPTYGVLGRSNVADLVGDTRPFPIPEKVSGLEEKTIVDVASGQVISGCIDSAGDLYTWGAAINDMLGHPVDEDLLVPQKVPKTKRTEGQKFRALRFGGQHSTMMAD